MTNGSCVSRKARCSTMQAQPQLAAKDAAGKPLAEAEAFA
jgi:hypothetical protein